MTDNPDSCKRLIETYYVPVLVRFVWQRGLTVEQVAKGSMLPVEEVLRLTV
ncbi:MAG: hypothetical protein IJP62_07700 [Treponema sp.]|nr:hypothetical protein [Treponema sp.]